MEQKTDAQKTILIVEDEKNIVDILRKLLPVFVATCLKASTDRQYVTHCAAENSGGLWG